MDSPSDKQNPGGPHDSRRDGGPDEPSRMPWSLSIFVFLGLLALAGIFWFQFAGLSGTDVPYSLFRVEVEKNNVSEILMTEEHIIGQWKDPPAIDSQQSDKKLPKQFRTALPPMEDRDLLKLLSDHGVKTTVER